MVWPWPTPARPRTYHSSPTARDRDRLRQEHLERLGWRFHRIWSIEWFRHRDNEIARAVAAWKGAIDAADAAPGPEPSSPAPSSLPGPGPLAADPGPFAGPVVTVAGAAANGGGRPARKGPMPVRARLGPISSYSRSQLVALINWIQSDTLLRTDEELLNEAVAALGYRRRGTKIVAAIEAAIAEAHRRR